MAFFGGAYMTLPISARLLACARLVHPGDRVADVGCDHGYLGIYLLQEKIASAVLACDVKEMPLLSALSNSRKFGVEGNMRFFQSDGLRSVPRDFDCLVCAGMGADTILSILEGAPWLRGGSYRLILQCQSKTPMLREYLSGNGWQIAQEEVLQDKTFLYTVMEVLWQPDAPRLTPGQTYFPPILTGNPPPLREAYLRRVVYLLQTSVRGKAERASEFQQQALHELLQICSEEGAAIL